MSNLNDGQNKKIEFTCGDTLSKYNCNYCHFKTVLRISLNNHVWKLHQKGRKTDCTITNYTCVKCNYTTHSYLMLYQHGKRCTPANDKKGFRFDYPLFKTFHRKINQFAKPEESLKVHTTDNFYSGVAKKKPIECDYKKTASISDLKLHQLDNGLIHWYNCDYCSFVTMHERYLNDHIARIHRRFECKKCDFKGITKRRLSTHIRLVHERHINERTNSEEINKSAKAEESLKEHTIINIINNQFCLQDHNYCSTVAEEIKPSELKLHQLNNGLSDTKKVVQKNGLIQWHKCDYCSFKTMHKRYLKHHFATAHRKIGIKFKYNLRFNCGQCGFETTSKQKFTLHNIISRHITDNFRCSLCNYSTHKCDSLENHFLVCHCKEQGEVVLYKCDHCLFQTNSTRNLAHHVSEHSNDCIICGYKSKGHDELREHYVVHHPEELYKCTQCPFTTIYDNCIKSHICYNHRSTKKLGSDSHAVNHPEQLVTLERM